MMDCGNCGYWKFTKVTDIIDVDTLSTRHLSVGICSKIKGPHYNQVTPYCLRESCWEPEGGRGPAAVVPPEPILSS